MISAKVEAPLRWLTDSTFSLFERYGFKYSSWTPNACGKDYGSGWYAEIDDESIQDWALVYVAIYGNTVVISASNGDISLEKVYGFPNKYINNIVCDNPGFLVWVDDIIGKFLYENGLLINKNKRKVKK